MTAAVAGGYARTRVKRLFQGEERALEDNQLEMQRIGVRIASTLGQLKGAAMKIGQVASVASELLPKELAEALQTLQKEAPPVDFSVIEAQILAEFDQPLELLFERFDPEPFAAASIGQVHRARVDGREVICKVQYPGVDAAVDSDMRHLKLALLASGLLRVNKRALDAAFREISARLHEELDYCNESDNLRAFRAFHARHPFVVVPEVVGHRSAKRVLTLEYVSGDSLNQLDALGYTPEERDRCALHLWQAVQSQIFDLGVVHADPNPANFAFRKDGTVVFFDFGCVKRLEPGLVDRVREFLIQNLREDYPAVDRALIALGIRSETSADVFGFYKRARDLIVLPFLASDPFDFARARFAQDGIATLAPDALRLRGAFQPSSALVFLNRTLVGHYLNLRAMGARIHVGELLSVHMPEIAPWFHGAPTALPQPT